MFKFMKFKLVFFLISAAIIVPGIVSLVKYGLKPSIDFVGGTTVQLHFTEQHPNPDDVKDVLAGDIPGATFSYVSNGDIIASGQAIEEGNHLHYNSSLKKAFGQFSEVSYQVVGPAIGQTLILKTLVAVIVAAVVITLYIAWQFKDWKFGLSAVIAMVHDSLVILGAFSLLGHFWGVEIDTLFVTAVLTTLSFSVHDTIVVFDRVRELRKLHPEMILDEVMDVAINQTLIRSLNNSLTVIIMLVCLVTLAAGSVRWLAVALLIGAVTGTYSSIFTAVPLVAVFSSLADLTKKLPKPKLPKRQARLKSTV